jgi:hypothetical protein
MGNLITRGPVSNMSEMRSPYSYKSERTHLIKAIKQSLSVKKKAGWSRDTGPGFICEDILSVRLEGKNIQITTSAFKMSTPSSEFNLRETKEILKFLEKTCPCCGQAMP